MPSARVGPGDHHRGVPADEGPDPPLEVLVARGTTAPASEGMVLTYGVDTVAGKPTCLLAGPLEEPHQQVAGAGPSVGVDDVVEGVQPLGGLGRVGVG